MSKAKRTAVPKAHGTVPTLPAVPKPLLWVGAAEADYAKLPKAVKKVAGTELLTLQYGGVPSDCDPMTIIGSGAFELRVDTRDGWFRVFYVAKFAEALYVLHSFQKKTNRTARQDISMGQQRYTLLMKERINK